MWNLELFDIGQLFIPYWAKSLKCLYNISVLKNDNNLTWSTSNLNICDKELNNKKTIFAKSKFKVQHGCQFYQCCNKQAPSNVAPHAPLSGIKLHFSLLAIHFYLLGKQGLTTDLDLMHQFVVKHFRHVPSHHCRHQSL